MKNNNINLKSLNDIKKIKESGKIISNIFMKIPEILLAGISTWDLDLCIEEQINKQGGRSAFKTIPGYDYSSCISLNNEVVHGIPSKKRIIKNGDIVKIDIGVVLKGYFSDACNTFAVGKISTNAENLIKITFESLMVAIGEMHPGNRIDAIGKAIQENAEKNNYSVVKQFSGHGVGYALHEPPSVPHFKSNGVSLKLQEGMVLAVEPILNKGSSNVYTMDNGWTVVTEDGELSAQFEHTIAITKNGPIVLTE